MPADEDPGMAFVLVQHLAPDHRSLLTELIRRFTRMQVFEVTEGIVIEENCAYIIPPNRDMALMSGSLHLLEPIAPRGQRLPIDFFFRSMAQDQKERAVGIILSGSGRDGTLGVRDIKGAGGMVMVQTPASAQYDGMPRSALATGLVDFDCLPDRMADQLIAYTRQAFFGNLTGHPSPPEKTPPVYNKLLVLLRSRIGHDFSLYKPNTIRRRIERRMAVHQLASLDQYLEFIQNDPEEIQALFQDLLIGVTQFFRDPAAFSFLEENVIPRIFDAKSSGGIIRVWCAGCSTGEEAYSLAILMQERLDCLKKGYQIQIFATDLDSRAVSTARAGLYPASIARDITPERLSRFFIPEPDGTAYRLHKVIRDLVIFSEQNIIKDPPFSHLDLISCRNLLIYMGPDLQRSVIPIFHYALDPDGILFLGSSETIGGFNHLFQSLNRKIKVYKRTDNYEFPPLNPMRVSSSPASFSAPVQVPHPAELPMKRNSPTVSPLQELTEKTLLKNVIPTGALVTARGDLLYLHGRTGTFLEPVPGDVGINNILKMAREGLRASLTSALHRSVSKQEVVHIGNLQVLINANSAKIDVSIYPVPVNAEARTKETLYVIALREARGIGVASASPANTQQGAEEKETPVGVLRRELRVKEEILQNANEELEATNEELKSSNEEMQSINEELQSSNEELETSKEELQSVNEELATVNAELQAKVADLSRVNNDMNNLLAGTGIGTVFVDLQLCIMRYTPTVTRIINLIPGDVGRPVGHLVSNLKGPVHLIEDVEQVLENLIPIERDVETKEGKPFAMRIQPYRTLDNVIEGAVITFTEIIQRKRPLDSNNS